MRAAENLGRFTAADTAGDHAVVIWHEPYWTSTTATHTPTLAEKPWIDLLWKHHVPLLLNGHQHGYARFHPQDNTGARNDALGIQEFIVGTGGIGFYPWTDTATNVVTQEADTFGWLNLLLHPGRSQLLHVHADQRRHIHRLRIQVIVCTCRAARRRGNQQPRDDGPAGLRALARDASAHPRS